MGLRAHRSILFSGLDEMTFKGLNMSDGGVLRSEKLVPAHRAVEVL